MELSNLNPDVNRHYKSHQIKKMTYSFTGNTGNTSLNISLPVGWFKYRSSQIVRVRLDSLVSDEYAWVGTAPQNVYVISAVGFPYVPNFNNGINYLGIVKTEESIFSATNAFLSYYNNGTNNENDFELSQNINITLRVLNSNTGTYNLPAGTNYYGTMTFELLEA